MRTAQYCSVAECLRTAEDSELTIVTAKFSHGYYYCIEMCINYNNSAIIQTIPNGRRKVLEDGRLHGAWYDQSILDNDDPIIWFWGFSVGLLAVGSSVCV